MTAKQKTVPLKTHREALLRMGQLNEALRAAANESQMKDELVATIGKELQDAVDARNATQELLNALLSPEPNAAFSHEAVALRSVLCSMLERKGWMDPMSAAELKRQHSDMKLQLTIVNKRMAVADKFGVPPQQTVVSEDGQLGAALIPLSPQPQPKPAAKKN